LKRNNPATLQRSVFLNGWGEAKTGKQFFFLEKSESMNQEVEVSLQPRGQQQQQHRRQQGDPMGRNFALGKKYPKLR
jgi:hypothetical protein